MVVSVKVGNDMKQSGFTLLELMIVVAIVGILAAIAYPSFQNQVFKAKRSDAYDAITDLQFKQQKIRANCRFYAGALAAADACGATATATTVDFSATSGDHRHTPHDGI